MRKILLFLFTLYSFNSYSGIDKGNGGDLVQCDGESTLYDFYEQQIINNIEIDYEYFDIDQDFIQNAYLLIDRVKAISPFYGHYLETKYHEFYRSIEYVKDYNFPDIDNSDHRIDISNSNCELKQVAINFFDNTNTTKFYLDMDLLYSLDSVNQAALIFHEIIYQSNIEIKDKETLRRFIAKIFSKNLDIKTEKKFIDYLVELDLHKLKYYRRDLDFKNLKIKDNLYIFILDESSNNYIHLLGYDFEISKFMKFDQFGKLHSVYVKDFNPFETIYGFKTLSSYTGEIKAFTSLERDYFDLSALLDKFR